jgi:tRNA N6-adenosine threonylcarbamoyltransferase
MPVTPTILGLETSCDETAAALIGGDGLILASVVASQHDVHARYGGVVPELAARRHIERLDSVVRAAMDEAGTGWSDLAAIAVTYGPGLAGALVAGVSFGKALAYATGLPLIAVNHLDGHLASAWMEHPDFPVPCVVLVVSGGHTHLYKIGEDQRSQLIGQTLDDAAGEAFDKAASMLGLPYPGGPAIDRVARDGNARAVKFPRPNLRKKELDFSFSGLKTALLYHLRDLDEAGRPRDLADLAASYQEAIVEVLVDKAFEAVRRCQVPALAVVGGVSANSRLRTLLSERASRLGIRLAIPRLEYCTDNAAMIAAAGLRAFRQGRVAGPELEADPDLTIPSTDFSAYDEPNQLGQLSGKV